MRISFTVAVGLLFAQAAPSQMIVHEIHGDMAQVVVEGEVWEVREGDQIPGEGRVVGIGRDAIDLEVIPASEGPEGIQVIERIPRETTAVITLGVE